MNDCNALLISVIVPTRHRNAMLALCLNCLAPGVQTLAANWYEVIVTDDGSQSTAETLICERYPWVHWTAGPCRGPAANRNHGAQYARGKWLAFTDDDCLPDAEWLSAFVAATSGSVLALEGAIQPLGDVNQDLADCPVNTTGGYFWTANVAVKRSLFEQIDGFDPTYPMAAHEDVDIKLRLKLHTEIMFLPDAIVVHPVRFLSFTSMVAAFPKRCAAWAHHVNKHHVVLGYDSKLSLTISQYRFHGRHLLLNASGRKYGNFCLSLIMLLVGIPLIMWQVKIGSRSPHNLV